LAAAWATDTTPRMAAVASRSLKKSADKGERI
jgi:hypothetical protein